MNCQVLSFYMWTTLPITPKIKTYFIFKIMQSVQIESLLWYGHHIFCSTGAQPDSQPQVGKEGTFPKIYPFYNMLSQFSSVCLNFVSKFVNPDRRLAEGPGYATAIQRIIGNLEGVVCFFVFTFQLHQQFSERAKIISPPSYR